MDEFKCFSGFMLKKDTKKFLLNLFAIMLCLNFLELILSADTLNLFSLLKLFFSFFFKKN